MDRDTSFTGHRLDARSLGVLAHPLRSRLLSALRVSGPATATELAIALKTNTGATSYHLRRLESVGLVADSGEGKGKRRLWRAATDSHQFDPSDFAGDETAEADLRWLVRDYSHHLTERFAAWLEVEPAWPADWRDVAGMNDDIVTLTAAQTQAMTEELNAVVARYRTVGRGDPAARRLSVWRVVYPLDTDQVPREDDQ